MKKMKLVIMMITFAVPAVLTAQKKEAADAEKADRPIGDTQAAHGNPEEGRFQPSPGKTIEQTLKEAKEEYNARVAARRAELPALKKQLAEEKKIGKREDIVDSLGRTEDAQAIEPVNEVLQNESEGAHVRELAAESLYKLYRPGLVSGKSLDVKDREKILNSMKTLYSKQDGEFKCVLADKLYKMGEKNFVRPGILECLKAGRWANLNTFYYVRKVDGVMIRTSIPGESNPIKVDEDSHEILKEAYWVGYPEEIRVKAAEMLVKLDDKNTALKAVTDLIDNGKTYEYRARALHLIPKIGTAEAKTVLENALKKPELKESAEGVLKWEWGK